MKKMLALFLTLSLALGMLAGCGGNDKEETKAPESKAETAGEAKESTAAETAGQEPSGSQTGEGKTYNFYGIYKMGGTYFDGEAASIEARIAEKAKEYGFAYKWNYVINDMDPEKCLTQVDTAIADKADAIFICVPDQTMSQSVVEKCEAAGIPVVACDDGLIDDAGNKIAPWFGIDAYNIGYAAGEWMADYAVENKLLEDESTAVLYATMDTVSSCVPRTDGEKQAWQDKLGDALSDRTYFSDSDGTVQKAYDAATSVISAHPEIKNWLVMTACGNCAQGAAAALENAGLDQTSCVIAMGAYDITDQWKEGNLLSIRAASHYSGEMVGDAAAEAVAEYVANGTELPKEYATPAVICTPDNWKEVTGWE